jgi:hypothetical protein
MEAGARMARKWAIKFLSLEVAVDPGFRPCLHLLVF